MKKLFAILTAVLLTANVFAQAPEKLSYQDIVRNSENNLASNTQVDMQTSIQQSTADGTSIYEETQTPTTNANGLYAEMGVTDYDGNHYKTIIIGNQVWMAENLKVIHYPNGDPIPLVADNTAWGNLGNNNTGDAYCYYNNDANSIYGALYTYAAAIGANWKKGLVKNQGVCPNGWHLPSDAEWTELENYISSNGHSETVGTALKSKSGWNSNSNGTDNYGFNALPGGYRYYNDGSFYNVGKYGGWWSSTKEGSSGAYYRDLFYFSSNISKNVVNKLSGFSVRCVKN